MRRAAALVFVVGLIWAPQALAVDRFVDDGGTDTGNCTSSASPCETVNFAVGLSAGPDRVYVGAGTYDEALILLDVDLIHDPTVFAGGSGPAILDNGSVADADDTSDLILPGDGSLIEGFTLRSPQQAVRTIGSATIRENTFDQSAPPDVSGVSFCQSPLVQTDNGNGQAIIEDNSFDDPVSEATQNQIGICAANGTEPIVRFNSFDNLVNGVRVEGGGGDSDGIDPEISNNTITNIRDGAAEGDGISVRNAEVTITANTINPPLAATGFSAGIELMAAGTPTGATLVRNRVAGWPVGIRVSDTDQPVTLNGDLIIDHTSAGLINADNANTGPGDITATNVTVVGASGVDIQPVNALLTLDSSIVGTGAIVPVGSGSCSITYSRGPVTGADCDDFDTTADPLFVNPGAGNFHLQSNSTMIDAGNPAAPVAPNTLDFDGDARALDATPECTGNLARRDIGADEFSAILPDCLAPNTTVAGKRTKKSRKRRARFSFTLGSSEPGSSFECKLDSQAFVDCTSPFARKVRRGKHTLQVRATDAAGNTDASPAKLTFRLKKKPRRRR